MMMMKNVGMPPQMSIMQPPHMMQGPPGNFGGPPPEMRRSNQMMAPMPR